MSDNTHFVQVLATVLIVFGALAVGVADHANLRDLANVGTTIVGGGLGLLTGQKLASVTNKDGATINVTPGGDEPGK